MFLFPRNSVRLGAIDRVRHRPEGRGRHRLVHLEARVEEGGYGRRVHPSASAPSPGRPRPSSPRSYRGTWRGGRTRPTRPHGERGRLRGSGRITWRRLLSPCPSRGEEGRGCRHLVHLEACLKEGGHGRRVHLSASVQLTASAIARKAVAVIASSISRPESRRADTAVVSIRPPRCRQPRPLLLGRPWQSSPRPS